MGKDMGVNYRHIGTRSIRPDGVEKVTGKANYGADHYLPGMLYGRILRSPHAHARIVSIDFTRALAMPGVLAVTSAADLPELTSKIKPGGESGVDYYDLSCNILARDKVLYHGHALAAVAATSPELAAAALEAIDVEYEPLPHVIGLREAMADNAPVLHEGLFTDGLEAPADRPSNVASRKPMT